MVIKENNEPMVEIKETNRLKVGLVNKGYQPSFCVRRTVAEKLYKISKILPTGINLVFVEGYKTLKTQQESWDKKFEKLKIENPTWSYEEIEKQVRLVTAKPDQLANHHCGGAVDITLAYTDNTLLDMGTPYPTEAMSADWHEKFKMLSDKIAR